MTAESAESCLSVTGTNLNANKGLDTITPSVNVLSLTYSFQRSKFIKDFKGCHPVTAVTPYGGLGAAYTPLARQGPEATGIINVDNSRALCARVAG